MLVFRAGSHLCALGVESVVEIMRPLPVERLAGVPRFVAGVSVIRGEPVPVVDGAELVGGGGGPATRYVLVTDGRRRVALAVGSVLGMLDPGPQHDLPPLLEAAGSEVLGALGVVDGEPLLVLRGVRIVPDEVWSVLAPELVG
jgi:purine-binding chemotaxis protein CheW